MIATAFKFVPWDTKPLEALKDSIVFKMRSLINSGVKLNRAQKNWITNRVNNNSYFNNAIPLQGWAFSFSDVLKKFVVKQCGHCAEYYAVDKTSLREYLGDGIEYIVEVK
ncbi:molybdenum ABC transporter ATP-binding protein [uncultured Duncaniella sp.]|uniref:molybdenum ABC transporter ATP-binding protein n=1 Tax=uncultured Duncaniella sp. TaxID=2768039 RepID=UPI0025A94EFB|nr:molybdenum ABC transporter ATP-binding protein [uncultured Duncaniella sp.]